MLVAVFYICSKFFGTFNINIFNYTAGSVVILELSKQATSTWTLLRLSLVVGWKELFSVGGSIPSPCPVLLKLNSSAFPPQKESSLLRWQNANKTERVCFTVLC